MGIFKMMRYFAWSLIVLPAAVILFGLLCTYLPGAAAFLSNIFWGLLGETEIFSLASEVLQGSLSYQHFSGANYVAGFLSLLVGALAEAAIMAFCVFAVKSAHVFFNRTWHGKFTRPVWLLTLVGVLIGVVVCSIKGQLTAAGQSVLMLVVCLGCYIFGIVMMLKGGSLKAHPTYRNRRAGFIIKMLAGVVGNMLDAFCGVFIITAIMEGPIAIKGGGSIRTWIVWILLSIAVLHLKSMITAIMEPQDV